MKLMIAGGNLVLPDRVEVGDVWIEDGTIARVTAGMGGSGANEAKGFRVLDASGRYVLPGLIDLHCDAIEKEVQPRPNTLFPLKMAFLKFERQLPVYGITSIYHSLSLGVGLSLRGDSQVTGLIDVIRERQSCTPVVRNRIHLRYEVSHREGGPIVERCIREGHIDYLSFMDHSPGQGQYRKPGSFERYVMKNQGVDVYEVQTIVEELMKRRREIDWNTIRALARAAVQAGIPMASHDDDTPQRVEESKRLGVTVSEFPVALDTARYAAEQGLYVCVGAPNVVRGASHDGNLRAADAIAAGAAHILCSDYHPGSLLAAVFKLADEAVISLPEACAMATLNPAKAAGADGRLGSLAEGKAADILVVDRYDGYPWVVHAIVDGRLVYSGSDS